MPLNSGNQTDGQMNIFFLDLVKIWRKHDRMIESRRLKPPWQFSDDAAILLAEKTIYAEAYARVKHKAEH